MQTDEIALLQQLVNGCRVRYSALTAVATDGISRTDQDGHAKCFG